MSLFFNIWTNCDVLRWLPIVYPEVLRKNFTPGNLRRFPGVSFLQNYLMFGLFIVSLIVFLTVLLLIHIFHGGYYTARRRPSR